MTIGFGWLVRVCLLGAMLSTSALAHAAGVDPGDSRIVVDARGTEIEVFVHKPANYDGRALIVSLHGLGRNAAGYRNSTRALGEQFGALVIVPLFDRERFPTWRFQQGGIVRRDAERVLQAVAVNERTSDLLKAVIDQIRAAEGAPDMPYVLLGHSAGGQFLSRIAALAPLDPIRIIIANPGTWLTPSLEERFPYGLGGLPDGLADASTLARYLAQPITVMVGTADTETDDLSMTSAAKRQGDTRHARALRVFAQAKAQAEALKLPFGWHLLEIPGVGHSARAMYEHPLAGSAFCPVRPASDHAPPADPLGRSCAFTPKTEPPPR